MSGITSPVSASIVSQQINFQSSSGVKINSKFSFFFTETEVGFTLPEPLSTLTKYVTGCELAISIASSISFWMFPAFKKFLQEVNAKISPPP